MIKFNQSKYLISFSLAGLFFVCLSHCASVCEIATATVHNGVRSRLLLCHHKFNYLELFWLFQWTYMMRLWLQQMLIQMLMHTPHCKAFCKLLLRLRYFGDFVLILKFQIQRIIVLSFIYHIECVCIRPLCIVWSAHFANHNNQMWQMLVALIFSSDYVTET